MFIIRYFVGNHTFKYHFQNSFTSYSNQILKWFQYFLIKHSNIPELKVFIHILSLFFFKCMSCDFQHNLIRNTTGKNLDLPPDSQLHKTSCCLHLNRGAGFWQKKKKEEAGCTTLRILVCFPSYPWCLTLTTKPFMTKNKTNKLLYS